MDDEFKKRLDEFLKNVESPYSDLIRKNIDIESNMKTPARIKNEFGVKIPANLFDEKHVDCHRHRIKQIPFMALHEFGDIEKSLMLGEEMDIKFVHEFIEYANDRVEVYKKSCAFLKNAGEKFKKDFLFIAMADYLTSRLKEKYKI